MALFLFTVSPPSEGGRPLFSCTFNACTGVFICTMTARISCNFMVALLMIFQLNARIKRMQIRQKAQCELCPLTRMLAMVVSCSFWVPSEGSACSSFHAASRRGEHGGGLCCGGAGGAQWACGANIWCRQFTVGWSGLTLTGRRVSASHLSLAVSIIEARP